MIEKEEKWKRLKIGDISHIISAVGTLLLIFITLKSYSEKLIALALAAFILFGIVLIVFHFDLWNKLKMKFHAFKLHIRVLKLVRDFEDIKARFDKFVYQNIYGTIFHIASELDRDTAFRDIFVIFEILRNVFVNRTYSDFKNRYNSSLKRKIKKKEEFISLLRDFINALHDHRSIIETFLALVENKRYSKASKEAVMEFTTFKENYNSYLNDCEIFIEKVNRNLGVDLHMDFKRINDEDVSKIDKLPKKEEK